MIQRRWWRRWRTRCSRSFLSSDAPSLGRYLRYSHKLPLPHAAYLRIQEPRLVADQGNVGTSGYDLKRLHVHAADAAAVFERVDRGDVAVLQALVFRVFHRSAKYVDLAAISHFVLSEEAIGTHVRPPVPSSREPTPVDVKQAVAKP